MDNDTDSFSLATKADLGGLMRHGVDVDHRPVGNPKRKV
jgi:hypothetical protein